MPTERRNERLARHIVSTALAVPVERYEDGSAPAQVDGVIRYAGRNGWLEIIGDHDSAFNSQWSALERINHQLAVPGLQRRWSVWLLRRASVKKVAQKLPDLLLRSQDAQGDKGMDIEDELAAIGVVGANRIDDDRSGVVHLHAEGWSGTAGRDDTPCRMGGGGLTGIVRRTREA